MATNPFDADAPHTPIPLSEKPWEGRTVTLPIYQAQRDFLDAQGLFKAFVGGRGAGKSYIISYDLIKRAKPNRLYMMTAPTYGMLSDATLRSFLDIGERLEVLEKMNVSRMCATLGNGAEVLFRSTENPERLRGPNLSGVAMDEASVSVEDAYNIVIACLRQCGEQGWLSAAFTPKGRTHWTYRVFGPDENGNCKPDTALIRSRTIDNPFLPEEFYQQIKRQYSQLLAAQELEGEFIEGGGYLFQRSWFKPEPMVPLEYGGHWKGRVRFWDLAATEQKEANDPDWTVGVLMGRTRDDHYYILDIQRVRADPLGVQTLVRNTAARDGRIIPIRMEEEGGSAGKHVIYTYRTAILAGYNFQGVRSTGDKVTRAQGFSGMAGAGHFHMLKAPWNKDFLDEIETAPYGDHDDQWDACSGAYNELTAAGIGSAPPYMGLPGPQIRGQIPRQ